MLTAATPPRPSQPDTTPMFELRCSEAHPVQCDLRLRSRSVRELVDLVREHGARDHGFTSLWYTPERVRPMIERMNRDGRYRSVSHG